MTVLVGYIAVVLAWHWARDQREEQAREIHECMDKLEEINTSVIDGYHGSARFYRFLNNPVLQDFHENNSDKKTRQQFVDAVESVWGEYSKTPWWHCGKVLM